MAIKLCCTKDMPREEWLEWRRGGIGGSDAAVIVGLNPYGSLIELYGKGGTSTEWRDRVFVPSTVYDNQELLNNDPTYLANLAMLPEAERNALLLGSWDSADYEEASK